MPATKKSSKRKKKQQPADHPIQVIGARTHNLKNISCEIPSGTLTAITGVSGSGKSSLAFDTLFAEGQRRYVESLSTYARQFIARMPRPDVDEIDNIPPAIALEQKNSVKNARSTIGTATEINDFLRLIFAKIGETICPDTGLVVKEDSPGSAATLLLQEWESEAVYIIAPIKLQNQKMLEGTVKELQRQGFTRLYTGDQMEELDDPDFSLPKDTRELSIVIDRLKIGSRNKSRLTEAIESAYRVGQGRCIVKSREGNELFFSEEKRCAGCDGSCSYTFREPTPQLLNFSSPLGACDTCQGFGRVTGLDPERIIPNEDLSLNDGAIACFSGDAGKECLEDLRRESRKLKVRMSVPYNELAEREKEIIWHGEGKWYGIDGFFEWLEDRRYKIQARVMLARYRGYDECPDCLGQRLKKEALAVKLGGHHIGEICALSVDRAFDWLSSLKLTSTQKKIVERPLDDVLGRLSYLKEVGLGYLTLSRQTRTLSGGESQRINLATALGSALTETLYVLDEPTVGLHPRDTDRLVGILKQLTELGNTVIVVEHDPDVIQASSHIIDIGPKAGEHGGEVLFEGSFADLVKSDIDSVTAKSLKENGTLARRSSRKSKSQILQKHGRRKPSSFFRVVGARENNLKNLTIDLPMGVLCSVTGVSGSGKSSLIQKCLYANYRRLFIGDPKVEPGEIDALEEFGDVFDIVMIDQSPIGRSSRSNAATYLKAYDKIRQLMASSPSAKALGLTAGDFSFNVAGGRCEACEGTGMQTIDMHFLADVSVTCDVCEGRRFQDQILQVEYNERTISQILSMTVNEALNFFKAHVQIRRGLEPLADVGLGYLRLGQSTATLSGGEAQRLKLASHLADRSDGTGTILLFDEPTTGLHPWDLDILLDVFERLVEDGYSLIIIEHNLQLISRSDYVIDLGPEGGEEGGNLVFEGTPEELLGCEKSITAQYLKQYISRYQGARNNG